MKRISILALAIAMAFTMVACGRRKEDNDSAPTQDNVTNNDENIVPDVIPDMDQNVPDPNVDSSMPQPSIDTEEDTSSINDPDQENNQGTENPATDHNTK